MKKPTALRNIHRIDNADRGTHAWGVCLQRHGVILTKTFSDGVWGGKRAALAAARAWRAEQLQADAEYEHKLWRRNELRRNNRSGIVGVQRYERKPPARGAPYWAARWVNEDGATRSKKFSVLRWGERGARLMAIEERDEQVRRAVEARVSRGPG